MSRISSISLRKPLSGWLLPFLGLALSAWPLTARASEQSTASNSSDTETIFVKADEKDSKSKKEDKSDKDAKSKEKKADGDKKSGDKKPEVKKDSDKKPEPKKDGDKKDPPKGPGAAWEQLRKRMEEQHSSGKKPPFGGPGFGNPAFGKPGFSKPDFSKPGFGKPGFGGPGGFGFGGKLPFGGFHWRMPAAPRDYSAKRSEDRSGNTDSRQLAELKREIESLRREVERLRGSLIKPHSAHDAHRAPAHRPGPPMHGFHHRHGSHSAPSHRVDSRDHHPRPEMHRPDQHRSDAHRPEMHRADARPAPHGDARRPEMRPESRKPDGDRKPGGDRRPNSASPRDGERRGPASEHREGDRGRPERRDGAEAAPKSVPPAQATAKQELLESLVQESLFNGNQQRADALILELLTMQR